MRKWLQDRQGRPLTFEDLGHYRRVASAIQDTIQLMQEADTAITQNASLW